MHLLGAAILSAESAQYSCCSHAVLKIVDSVLPPVSTRSALRARGLADALEHSPLKSDPRASRIKQEKAKKDTDALLAKHERAEMTRRRSGFEAAAPEQRPTLPLAPTVAYGGPVRGLSFGHVCNMRSITPGQDP